MTYTIFQNSRMGNLDLLRKQLEEKPDLSAVDEHGFTALHHAAMGSNTLEKSITLEILKLLVDAGSPLEAVGGGGRTALYLLAEFSLSVEPVQVLIDAGANPDVSDSHGNHVIENAMQLKVQQLLSDITGIPIPPKPEPAPPGLKMNATAWKKAKAALDVVFQELSGAGLIVLQDAGTTQSDGFADCAEVFYKHTNQQSILGFCFYTRQDLSRAKRSSELPLAIWGAPEGDAKSTKSVGEIVVAAFQKAGIRIDWNGSSSMRPSVYLHRFSE